MDKSPFEETPKTNERAHWVKPKVVVEVKFSEWTGDGKLRQPIYLGTRDDKKAAEVGRESTSMQKKTPKAKAPAKTGLNSKSKARQRVYAKRTIEGDVKKSQRPQEREVASRRFDSQPAERDPGDRRQREARDLR